MISYFFVFKCDFIQNMNMIMSKLLQDVGEFPSVVETRVVDGVHRTSTLTPAPL